LTGTSVAAPMVTGAVAALLSKRLFSTTTSSSTTSIVPNTNTDSNTNTYQNTDKISVKKSYNISKGLDPEPQQSQQLKLNLENTQRFNFSLMSRKGLNDSSIEYKNVTQKLFSHS
jgi:hypothetical protein